MLNSEDYQLIGALENGNYARVEKLLEQGASPNAYNSDECNKTALQYAVKSNRAMNLLLHNDVNVYAEDDDGDNALHYCVYECEDIESAEKLLNKAHDIIDRTNNDGKTALHCAVAGKSFFVDFLCSNDADKNIRDFQGNTPLHLALVEQNLLSVKILLRHKASVNIQNHEGNTALHVAVDLNYDASVISSMLNLGADITIKNTKGNTPDANSKGSIKTLFTNKKKDLDKLNASPSRFPILKVESEASSEMNKNENEVSDINEVSNEDDSMLNEIFGNFKFGEATDARITFNGKIAIKSGSRFKVYDPEKKAIIDSTEITINKKGLVMKLPVQQCEEGDVIIKSNRYYFVRSVNEDNEINVVSLDEGKIEVFAPEASLIGINFFVKAVNLFNFKDGNMNPMTMMMINKMSKKSISEDEDMLSLFVMHSLLNKDTSQLMSNPIFTMMMMGDGKSMGSTMLMMSMMNNNNLFKQPKTTSKVVDNKSKKAKKQTEVKTA